MIATARIFAVRTCWTRLFSSEVDRGIERAFRQRKFRFNPRDQFGTMSRGAPQNERMARGRNDDDFWRYEGEDVLRKEKLRADEYIHEMLATFANPEMTPQITEPYRSGTRREDRRKAHMRSMRKLLKR